MKLFFETAGQARSFLMCIPLGFLLFLLLDNDSAPGMFRFLLDFFIVLFYGALLMQIMIQFQENALREFHLLGSLSGGILYLSGVSKIRKSISAGIPKLFKQKRQEI